MKPYTLPTLALFLLTTLTACGTPTEAQVSSEPVALTITASDTTLSLTWSDITGHDQETFTTTHVNGAGDVTEHTVTGFSVASLLDEARLDFSAATALTLTAADDYQVDLLPEDYLENGLYLLTVYDDVENTTPQSCIPNMRSMYWVSDLVSIDLTF